MSRENPNIFHFIKIIKRKEKEHVKRKPHPQSERKTRGHVGARSPHETRTKRKAKKTESARFQKAGKEENTPKGNGQMQKKQEKTRGSEKAEKGKNKEKPQEQEMQRKREKSQRLVEK